MNPNTPEKQELVPPFFLSLEGLNASGKTTLGKLLFDDVTEGRIPGFDKCLLTREIGGTETGEYIRGLFVNPPEIVPDATTELLLINAARREHLRQSIVPELLRGPGRLIICDRYIASTYAYQVGYKGEDPELVSNLHSTYCGNVYPDLTLYIDISIAECIKRTQTREWVIEDTIENIERLDAIQQGYGRYGHKVMEELSHGCRWLGQWHRLNGMLSKDTVHRRAVQLIREHSQKEYRNGTPGPGNIFGCSQPLPGFG